MKVAYFDCPAGASGDMILGALVDADLPLVTLESALAGLGISGWRLGARVVEKGGLRGTKVEVETDPGVRFYGLAEMLAALDKGSLSPAIRERAAAILRQLAEAEARVHRVPVETVHFHEVGSLDTLVDVVGAVAGLDALGVEAVYVSALPLGGGTVESAHGRIPVPAPATVELLKGFPVYDNGIAAELVTPTGAAILTTLARGAGRAPAMRLEAVGWGAGTQDLPIPNLLRVMLGTAEGPAGAEVETIAALETTIDDMSPQLYEPLMERLLEAGALDVFLTSVIMKRSRPGVVLTVLAPPERIDELADLLFRETTSIGVRWSELRRARLPRELVRLPTAFGPVTFKLSRLGGRLVTLTPEFEECRRIARERNLPVREVLEQLRAEGWRALGESP